MFEQSLTNTGASLTGYVLDASDEMPNTKVRPAILVMPGGAYRNCSDREGDPVAMAFLAEGYHAFVLRYSLNENAAFPAPLQDAEEALEIIHKNSEAWGIDSDKVAVCGFSAGGHLAAALGTTGRIRPSAMILGYPCILASDSPLFPHPIPAVDKVDDRTPPAFIFHTFNDSLVPVDNALAIASAMHQASLPFALHIFTDGVHGLSLGTPATSGGMRHMVNADVALWLPLCRSWLNTLFGEFVHDKDNLWDEHVEKYSIDIPLALLWNKAECKNLILSRLPMLENNPQISEAMGVPLRTILEYSQGLLTEEEIQRLDNDLQAIQV